VFERSVKLAPPGGSRAVSRAGEDDGGPAPGDRLAVEPVVAPE
jgi:hypothetical protein